MYKLFRPERDFVHTETLTVTLTHTHTCTRHVLPTVKREGVITPQWAQTALGAEGESLLS